MRPMDILIGCEFSAIVRDEFRALGHNAWSCDLRDCERDSRWHIKGDVRNELHKGWDMAIFHPYCTFNNLAGIRWMYHPEDTHLPAAQRRRHPAYPNRMIDFLEGVEFFKTLRDSPIPKIALENSQPHGLAMEHLGRYDQMVQPWMFGSPYTKAAALWLKGLSLLVATHKKTDYEKITAACHGQSPGPNRERERSRTDPAIARAFALAWGSDRAQTERLAA